MKNYLFYPNVFVALMLSIGILFGIHNPARLSLPISDATAVAFSSNSFAQIINIIRAQAANINPDVLKVGLTAYMNARKQGLDDKQLMTLVDYSKPSSERRLWVIDMKTDKVLFNTWVAHGKNSGLASATNFSNDPHSLESSLGVFLTDAPYVGHDGYSLRIKGLEPSINDNAFERAIVFHGAWYATPTVAAERGMLGRSWGCLAVDPNIIKSLIDTIKDKTLVIAYYPDRKWLSHSSFLKM